MKKLAEYEVKFPAWALSYVVNGDSSGISAEDKKQVDTYMRQYEGRGHVEVCTPADDNWEPYFDWNPEFGLACDVVDCTILILA